MQVTFRQYDTIFRVGPGNSFILSLKIRLVSLRSDILNHPSRQQPKNFRLFSQHGRGEERRRRSYSTKTQTLPPTRRRSARDIWRPAAPKENLAANRTNRWFTGLCNMCWQQKKWGGELASFERRAWPRADLDSCLASHMDNGATSSFAFPGGITLIIQTDEEIEAVRTACSVLFT